MEKTGNAGSKTGLFIRWDECLLRWHRRCPGNTAHLHAGHAGHAHTTVLVSRAR